MSAKRADFFRGQFSPVFGSLGGGFYPSRSDHENTCLIEQGVGVGFREVQTFRRSRGRGVSGTPTKSGF